MDVSRRRLVRACEAIRPLLEEGSEALRGVAEEGLLRLAAEEVEEFLVEAASALQRFERASRSYRLTSGPLGPGKRRRAT